VSLLVVPLARDACDHLTLGEWRLLLACERVSVEDAAHPLRSLLAQAGVAVDVLEDEPDPDDAGRALVADPSSPRVVALARAGAVRRACRSLGGLTAIMARLRSDDGCPWDREQTHRSLVVHLLEEAYEVAETIESGGLDADLREELGDLLLQVAFHARLAEQEGRFDLSEVADAIAAKLVHRHPHVFGDVVVSGAGDVLRNWERIKAAERPQRGAFDGIPRAAPALSVAAETVKRAAGLGFTPSEERCLAEARGALSAGRVGEALFWTAAFARVRGEDPEGALRQTTSSFRRRWEQGADLPHDG
jgi:uncharacterized protein YabN with tetrapyrrole methylase and pyrophosphatase domain